MLIMGLKNTIHKGIIPLFYVRSYFTSIANYFNIFSHFICLDCHLGRQKTVVFKSARFNRGAKVSSSSSATCGWFGGFS